MAPVKPSRHSPSRDVPAIFSTDMVLALLDGRKTMTRRHAYTPSLKPSAWTKLNKGDRIWVRETIYSGVDHANFYYAAGKKGVGNDNYIRLRVQFDRCKPGRSVPAIHMPRYISRLTLEVEAVRFERLLAIKEPDCMAEGAELVRDNGGIDGGIMVRAYGEPAHVLATPRNWFRNLWDAINGPGAWDRNPEVVAVTFKVHKCNIDKMEPRYAAA